VNDNVGKFKVNIKILKCYTFANDRVGYNFIRHSLQTPNRLATHYWNKRCSWQFCHYTMLIWYGMAHFHSFNNQTTLFEKNNNVSFSLPQQCCWGLLSSGRGCCRLHNWYLTVQHDTTVLSLKTRSLLS